MFPVRICLEQPVASGGAGLFGRVWADLMASECHRHEIWNSSFVRATSADESDKSVKFQLAAVWAINMVAGSYCFPRYVAALAARAESDVVRYGLLENAWDEAGGVHHASRSHFWLAVRLARLLGLEDGDIERIIPLSAAQEYTDAHYAACAQGDFEEALGMICLIEEFTTPEFTLIFRAFLDSCYHAFGMSSEQFVLGGGAEYFTANIADDERHREEMPRLVAAVLRQRGVDLNDESATHRALEAVRRGVILSVSLRKKFFDEIAEFVGAGGTYRKLVNSQ